MELSKAKEIAASLLNRGVSAVRIKDEAKERVAQALTREDIRAIIKDGLIYAKPEKKNISMHGKIRRIKRNKGRSRGYGRRNGTRSARSENRYIKRIRAQRRLLKKLKEDSVIDNNQFKFYYRLVRGNIFDSKSNLLNRLIADGIKLTEEQIKSYKKV
ncbi:MAG: 50S ribosomal protein L19e [Candidatus Micrarchaeota archaeon]|nr:MAG: 50S ribosomal protein L19e [Candidatus Micrarchaeota archaeon]